MIQERVEALRRRMKEVGVDVYLVPTDDFHASEYVGAYFACREYITGFTGSSGTAVITQDIAGLWTDGRYFIQAEQELEGTGVTLFKMGEPGVPTVHEFLQENLGEGMSLGYDGRTVSAAEAEELVKLLAPKDIRILEDLDLVGDIWTDRPPLSCEPVKELDVKWTGESRASKLKRIRASMKELNADKFVLTSLDDIAWLLNIRGGDIPCCPVVLSYLLMSQSEVKLFANREAFPEEVQKDLISDGVSICPYDGIYEAVGEIPAGETLLLSRETVNSRLIAAVPEGVKILDHQNPTLLPKAMKNPTEVENERIAHIKDGVALTKFIYWVKQNIGKQPMTELSAQEKLYEFRLEQENFMGNSFDPIMSYGEHAAINHYSATEESDIPIDPEGFLLADTGGHYLEGSTDVTRTIAVGPLSEEQKRMYTVVLRGTLNLSAAKFRYGTACQNLDYLARGPLWEMGKDFNHGTGHGVGYYLNIHEGPNCFGWRVSEGRHADSIMEEGMITSDEPGYYVEGEYGIRLENLLLCVKDENNSYGQFMKFETLTFAPFDLDAVIPEEMTEPERELLNSYNRDVYEKISPYLDREEKAWLKDATREI